MAHMPHMPHHGEKHCPKCGEWWPADLEFFATAPAKAGGLFYCCRACARQLPSVVRRRGGCLPTPPRATDAIALLLTQRFTTGHDPL